ncbi:MAG: hypothetical protein ACI4WH_00270 [Oscillospiraceae bacterium]
MELNMNGMKMSMEFGKMSMKMDGMPEMTLDINDNQNTKNNENQNQNQNIEVVSNLGESNTVNGTSCQQSSQTFVKDGKTYVHNVTIVNGKVIKDETIQID